MASKRKVYEGSKEDLAEDKKGAKKLGITQKVYEQTARDKAEDRRGQAKLKQQRRM
jgi:hypothetical protein